MNSQGQRHLPLAGAYNIRDIGGYPTADGTTHPLAHLFACRFARVNNP